MYNSITYIIDGSAVESFGNFKTIFDTMGQQPVISSIALMLNGLCININEQWAPGVSMPSVTGWSLSFTTPSTTWSGITLPTTTWTLA